ncbi:MAG: trehalose-6-phosphate synthase [Ignavibacteria bacterium]|nr:MAG: trehalose-6-phosphate synthase [Ignavibacteria bacterium]
MHDSERTHLERLMIVSNRLPVVFQREDDRLTWRSGSGGLVTALAPVLRDRGGLWIGWSGLPSSDQDEVDDALSESSAATGYELKAVPLTEEELELYYHGFANEVLWPLFHDLQSHCNFQPEYWHSYLQVNRKFAMHIKRQLQAGDYIWVHDYHLMNVAAELRELELDTPVGFFLHIPFPPPDIFVKLPWRFHILRALLSYDLVGFQTMRDKRNFVQCLRMLMKEYPVRSTGGFHICSTEVRDVRIGVFPISIDYHDFERRARHKDVSEAAWYIHEHLQQQQIVLGIDRLDYTKGIPYRLKAFRNALRRFPELQESMTLVQVVVPSRTDIAKYNALKIEIESLVSEINGEFTRSGWVPIHYIFRHLTRTELLGYYRTAEIALITPIKDGMNLVAKEYCACNIEDNGVLILSEFAGTAAQLHKHALLVNPYDVEGVAEALRDAFSMPYDERAERMRQLRSSVRRYDIYRWVERFLEAAISRHLADYPVVAEYIPPDYGDDFGASV